MMKKSYPFIICLFLFFNFNSCQTAQTVSEQKFVEGMLTLKLKDEVPLTFSVNEDKTIPLQELTFLKQMIKPYGIIAVSRPFYLFDDPILLRTVQISFSKVKKIDALIKQLENIPEIEYVEKIYIKQKKGVKK